MQDHLKSRIIIFLSLTFFLIGNVDAQSGKQLLSYKKMMKLDKSLKGGICWGLFNWAQGYYSAYLEYPENIDEFFNFDDDDISLKIKSLLQNNKEAFSLKSTDSTLTIYYEKQLFFELSGFSLNCFIISEVSDYRTMVNMFDNQGICFWKEEIVNSFREDIIQVYKKCANEKYYSVLFPKDTVYIAASERPLVIVYQYDKEQGLSIHKICACKHKLLQNSYTKDLAELAEKYCEKYNLSKIIFAARVLRNENDE